MQGPGKGKALEAFGDGNGNPLQYSCHGQRSLAGCSPWGRKESDTTEQLSVQFIWGVLKTEAKWMQNRLGKRVNVNQFFLLPVLNRVL